ncbi:MAG: hypothetical protein V3U76_18905 [Granulosicoccus sp.]
MTIQILITSPPDREKVVAELWENNIQIAEVSREDYVVRVEFYTAPFNASFEYDELLDALQKARNSLIEQ